MTENMKQFESNEIHHIGLINAYAKYKMNIYRDVWQAMTETNVEIMTSGKGTSVEMHINQYQETC